MNFGVQRSLCDLNKNAPLLLWGDVDPQGFKDLKSLVLGDLESFGDDPGMEALADVDVGLLQELADEQDGGRSTVASNIILKENRKKIEDRNCFDLRSFQIWWIKNSMSCI